MMQTRLPCRFAFRLAAMCVVLSAARSDAITETYNRNIENDTNNRPFFDPAFFDPSIITNPLGYSGTAQPGVSNSSVVSVANVGLGGNDANGIPLGVGVNFGVTFTVETVDPSHVLTDGGNPGMGVNSGASDTNANELSAGETLRFSDIQLTNVSFHDPLNLIDNEQVGNLLWRVLRSGGFQPTDKVTVSSDSAGAVGTFNFAGDGMGDGTIGNNFTTGVFPEISPLYVNTTAGNWPLKGVGYQVDVTFDPVAAPAARRTFKFGEPVQPGTYEGFPTAQLTAGDTAINIAAIGTGALLDTNTIGVGVNTPADDAETGNDQRFINGSLGESLEFSFDRAVSLESITLGNLDLDGTEGVVLSFVSGTNPFAGLTGYSGDYTLGAGETSLIFNNSGGGQTPYTIAYGMGAQDPIEIDAGTVLSITSNPVVSSGFILDMITVTLPEAEEFDADFDDDNDVDGVDLATWQSNYGNPATATTGDANGDALADGADFLQWQREVTPTATAAAVPEPAALGLALIVAACGLSASRRKA